MPFAHNHTNKQFYRVIGGKKACNNFKDGTKLVDSIAACAFFAKKDSGKGFCIQRNLCYIATDVLSTVLATANSSTECEKDGMGEC